MIILLLLLLITTLVSATPNAIVYKAYVATGQSITGVGAWQQLAGTWSILYDTSNGGSGKFDRSLFPVRRLERTFAD